MSNLDILKRLPICNWEWPKPLVYVPMPQALPFADDVFPAFIEIARTGVEFLHLPYGFADRMRNFAALDFMNNPQYKHNTHLIMLDSDHIHPPNIVQRLCRWVLEDPSRQIVAGLNFKRCPPFSPCAYIQEDDGMYRLHEWDDLEGQLLEVAATGFGAVMFAREVFEQVEKPWFFHDFSGAKDDPDFKYPGHDIDFCRRAVEQGIKVYVDTSLTSPHMMVNKVTEKTYRTFCQMQDDLVVKEKVLDNGG